MYFHTIVTLAALFNLASAQAPAPAGDGAPLVVNTPTSVQACLPVALTWAGGVPPVYVSLINGGDPTSPILKDFGAQTDTSLTWDVDLPAGSSLTVQIRDSKGKLNYSDKFSIQPSSQTCKSAQPNSGGSAGKPASPSTPAATNKPASGAATPASPAGSSTGSSAGSTTPSTSGTSTTAASSTSGNPNTAATTPASPAGQAPKAAASRATPGLMACAIAGALAVFA